MDGAKPFRGSDAIADGLLTRKQLRGAKYQRIFPNIYLHRNYYADLRARSLAAYLYVRERGVLAGYSAAELHGAHCAPNDAEAEVLVPRFGLRSRPGLRVHRDVAFDEEIVDLDGVLATSPVRTAFDLARWLPLLEAVVAVDFLARVTGFTPPDVEKLNKRHPYVPWRTRIGPVLSLVDPRSESPMESRLRLAMLLRGLPAPTSQHWVEGPNGQRARLDLAYPEVFVAIEYDGNHHRDRETYAVDRRRDNWLSQMGWLILRFTSDDVLRRPNDTVEQIRRGLTKRQR